MSDKISPKTSASLLRALMSDAEYLGCNLVLEVSATGVMLKAQKLTTVAGTGTSVSRNTEVTVWVDRHDPNIDATITKALRSVP